MEGVEEWKGWKGGRGVRLEGCKIGRVEKWKGGWKRVRLEGVEGWKGGWKRVRFSPCLRG